ncbi:MAG: lipoyl synthase [Pseudomonadota bacterium]
MTADSLQTWRAPSRQQPDSHQRGAEKLKRIPVRVELSAETLPKPAWIRVPAGQAAEIQRVKRLMRESGLHTVCEEAACPNLGECFSRGTATFMILGDICTRRCPFCDVAHGKPLAPDPQEGRHLAQAVLQLGLRYIVITSVDRDDLRDGGASQFAACIAEVRNTCPEVRIEILVPDFRGRQDVALEKLATCLPDVFNHNLETVPALYRAVRPGADYQQSLALLRMFAQRFPAVPTKSGLMLGLGESMDDIRAVMQDLREHGVSMLTLGQYLRPSADHLPVRRYITPDEFERLREDAVALGFSSVASAPLVRSSYHADLQASAHFET